MKRFFTIILLLLPTVASHTQDEPPFVATAKTSEGMIPMAYHVGYAYDDGLGVAVGYQEYNHPAIPIDFKGEIFLSDSIVTPDGRKIPMRWIARGAFQDCGGITEVHLPPTTYCISDLSFENCKSLRQITIPDSFKVFYPRAFIGCTGLRRITFLTQKPPKSYNNDTFDEQTYQTATVVFPAQTAEDYLNDPLCYRFRYHAETIPLYKEVRAER